MTTLLPSGVPVGAAYDCHMHVFDPALSLAAGATWPAPGKATLQHYRGVQAAAVLSPAVVVQSTAYGFDNRCILAAQALLASLASVIDAARGIVPIEPTLDDASVQRIVVDKPGQLDACACDNTDLLHLTHRKRSYEPPRPQDHPQLRPALVSAHRFR